MDRVTSYPGALIAETDPLRAQQNAMIALGWSLQATLGTATALDGFALTPTTPASLVLNLAPGTITQIRSTEATPWSSLPANTATSIIKQGVMHEVDPITFTPPTTTGFSQAFLIQAQYADLDTNPVLLPYYNAANPAQPYSGPGGNGQSQNTARLGIVAIQVKAGVAVNGAPTIPAPDAGWVGMHVVVLSAGQTSISSGNIAVYSAAPFVPVKLPGVPAGVQSGAWTLGLDTGAADAYAVTLNPNKGAPVLGQRAFVRFANANATSTPVISVNGLPNSALLRRDGGSPFAGDIPTNGWRSIFFDGAAWRLEGLAPGDLITGLQRLTVTPWIPVISRTTTTPPSSPATGDTYLVPTGATGAWSGQANKITEWTFGGWVFVSARDGHGIGLPNGDVWIKVGGVYVPLPSRVHRALTLSADLAVKGYRDAPLGPYAQDDVWIVGATPTGDFAGQASKIAVYSGGAWVFLTPVVGMLANYKDGTAFAMMWWTGTEWKALSSLNAIVQPTTINVAASGGSASPVNPLAGDAFDTVANAVTWLQNWSILGAGSVLLALWAGVHIVAGGYALAHPYASKITIRGAALPGAFPVHTDVVSTVPASRTAIRAKFSAIVSTTGSGVIFDSSFSSVQQIMFDHDGNGANADSAVMQRGATRGLFVNCYAFGCKLADGTGINISTSLSASLVWRDSGCAHYDNGAVARQNCLVETSTVSLSVCVFKEGKSALAAYTNGQINTSGGILLHNNTTAALNCGVNGLIRVGGTSALFDGNAANTFNISGRVEVSATSVTLNTQTGSFSHIAQAGGYSSVPNVGANTCSPTANTVGNDNSYIRRY